ncbi:MAG: hypothetical protein KBB75_02390 [Candidatus Pacebacteria bacterium]|nr:hypothetical protein [Candidatus Paceibacterota bacterium]
MPLQNSDHSRIPLIVKKKECEKRCDHIDGQLDFLHIELSDSQRWDDIQRYHQLQMSVSNLAAEHKKFKLQSKGYHLAILSHDLN